MSINIDFKKPAPLTSQREILREYANGYLRIEAEYLPELQTTVEYLNIMGLRIRRRHPQLDNNPHVSQACDADFEDMSFGADELELLYAAAVRYAIGHHTVFLGPSGFGKSRNLEFFAYLLNIPFASQTFNREMTGMQIHDALLWHWDTEVQGELPKAIPGVLPRAMEQGGFLLLDEFNNLEEGHRAILLQVTERPNNPLVFGSAPRLNLSGLPGAKDIVHARPGFFIAATGNYSKDAGAGELSPFTHREDRRIRPYLFGPLRPETVARRAVGRYGIKSQVVVDQSVLPQREFLPTERIEGSGLKRMLPDVPDQVVLYVADLFTSFHQYVADKILPQVKQEPKVYLNEITDRAFDHFMMFQLADTSRTERILESARFALEFYYLNAFRPETRIALPHIGMAQEEKARFFTDIDANDRVPVRHYLKWLIERILKTSKFAEANVPKEKQKTFQQKIQEIMSPHVATLTDPGFHPDFSNILEPAVPPLPAAVHPSPESATSPATPAPAPVPPTPPANPPSTPSAPADQQPETPTPPSSPLPPTPEQAPEPLDSATLTSQIQSKLGSISQLLQGLPPHQSTPATSASPDAITPAAATPTISGTSPHFNQPDGSPEIPPAPLERVELIRRIRNDYAACVVAMKSLPSPNFLDGMESFLFSALNNGHVGTQTLNINTGISMPSSPQTTPVFSDYYQSDYEESASNVPIAQKYALPSFEQIEASITPEIEAIYNDMLRLGLKPRLNLVPLGLRSETMFSMLNQYLLKRMAQNVSLHASDGFSQALASGTLRYRRDTQEILKTESTLTKAQFNEQNNGWLVQFAAMEPILPEAKSSKIPPEFSNLDKFYITAISFKDKGLNGMTWESFIMAQLYYAYEQEQITRLLDGARRDDEGNLREWNAILGGHLVIDQQRRQIVCGGGQLTSALSTVFLAEDKAVIPPMSFRPCFNIPLQENTGHAL